MRSGERICGRVIKRVLPPAEGAERERGQCSVSNESSYLEREGFGELGEAAGNERSC